MEQKKIALVTGVAGGIGSAVARLFLENGIAVVGMDLSLIHISNEAIKDEASLVKCLKEQTYQLIVSLN